MKKNYLRRIFKKKDFWFFGSLKIIELNTSLKKKTQKQIKNNNFEQATTCVPQKYF